MAMRGRGNRIARLRSGGSRAWDGIVGGCWGSGSCNRRLTILLFFGLLGLSHFLSERRLPGVEFRGAVGCDVSEGGRALVGGRGGDGTEEGGRCRGSSEEPTSEHDV